MTVREAYELISNLKNVKTILQSKYTQEQVVNNLELSRKIRQYNDEINGISEAILNLGFDDEYKFNTDLYIVKE